MTIVQTITDLEEQLRAVDGEIVALTTLRGNLIIAIDALRRVPVPHSPAGASCPHSGDREECERPIQSYEQDESQLLGNPPTQEKLRTDAMVRVLLAAGNQPMRLEMIYDRIIKHEGIVMHAKNPKKSVGYYLSKDPRFVNVGKGIWRLHDEMQDRYEEEESEVISLPLTERLNVFNQNRNGGENSA